MSTSKTHPLLTHARTYARKYHWALIPVRGKEPACHWQKYQNARPNDRQLIALLTSIRRVTGLAVVLGAVSDGLRVRDFDEVDAYHVWAESHPDLAKSLPTS